MTTPDPSPYEALVILSREAGAANPYGYATLGEQGKLTERDAALILGKALEASRRTDYGTPFSAWLVDTATRVVRAAIDDGRLTVLPGD